MYNYFKAVKAQIRKLSEIKIDNIKALSIFANILLLITIVNFSVPTQPKPVDSDVTYLTNLVTKYQSVVDSLECHTIAVKKSNVKECKKMSSVKRKSPRFDKSTMLVLEGFRVSSSCDKYLDEALHMALSSYIGSERPLITSMRRSFCSHSKHRSGKAVDINMDTAGREMLKHLITEEGKMWLSSNNLSFFIEDKPGSKRLREFRTEEYKDYLFENRGATGLHIHLYIV